MDKIKLAYIIDDDEIIIYLTKRILKEIEFSEKTESFVRAKDALEALKSALEQGVNIPDVILFDLKMPEMDGWQFIEAFNKIPGAKKIPTFVFTSSVDPRDKDKANKIKQIKGFIIKPLTRSKLEKILRLVT